MASKCFRVFPAHTPLLACLLLCTWLLPIAAQTCTDTVKNGQETDKDCGGAICPKCLTARTCLVGSDCLSGVCSSGKCAEPPQCYNKVLDRRETDVDCGGGECFEACWIGKKCAGTWDCRSRVCGSTGTCVEASTCKNGIIDGRETDVDCGGGGCIATCAKGRRCTEARDCSTGVCSGGVCVQPATCTNKIKDATEGDVDCGGSCDRQCGVSATCNVASDCASGVCTSGRCTDAPTCQNGIRDGRETDIDCGGDSCTASCAKGKRCTVAADCQTAVCSGGVCVQPATCTNGIKDATEGDVDCGGSCDRQCGVSGTCNVASDCISGVCTSGRCTDAPTCRNGIRDGRETDIDCGGGGCGMPCDVGERCASRWDCRTSNCTGNTCQQLLTCTNGVKDTTEGDVDCGWLCGRQCGVGATCRVAGDCISGVCTSGRCADAPTCTNNKMDGKETDIDCGGGGCGAACDAGETCVTAWDCKSRICTGSTCVVAAPTCTDGIKNGDESDTDCGGTKCPPCLEQQLCWQDTDCASQQCII